MIAYIEGKIDELTPDTAVIEAAGVGYELAVSLQTYEQIRGKERTRLYVHEQARQDQATQLFGFATREERSLFHLLLGVSGVGGQMARSVVSAYTHEELVRIIANGDKHALTAAKGVGKKVAERIVVELRDKVDMPVGAGYTFGNSVPGSGAGSASVEAVQALTMLGFPAAAAGKAVAEVLAQQTDIPLETVVKMALKRLTAK